MDNNEVIALLKKNQNKEGVQKWEQRNALPNKLKSFGIGLTVLRKLANQIGKNHELSLKLWESEYYDAKIIALLIDNPKKMTREQAEEQVDGVNQGHLAHVFSSCNASLAKTSFVVELACDWMKSVDSIRRRCSYGLLYEISKSQKKNAPDDVFFLEKIEYINTFFHRESFLIKGAMGGALIGIGKRNIRLNIAALKVARNLGPIQISADKNRCEPLNVEKHLTSDYIKKKFGILK